MHARTHKHTHTHNIIFIKKISHKMQNNTKVMYVLYRVAPNLPYCLYIIDYYYNISLEQ